MAANLIELKEGAQPLFFTSTLMVAPENETYKTIAPKKDICSAQLMMYMTLSQKVLHILKGHYEKTISKQLVF